MCQFNINECNGKVLELTGVSAIGKTRFLSTLQGSKEHVKVFDAGRFISGEGNQSKAERLITETLNMLHLLFNKNVKLSYSDVKWLFASSFNVRGSVLLKANIFINCLLKFSYYGAINRSDISEYTCIVDEGISHIPFLLQDQVNSTKTTHEFYFRFKEYLSSLNVICLDGDVNTVERLLLRGHKRLKDPSKDEIKRFDAMNRSTLKNVLKYSNFYKNFTIFLIK